MEDHIKLLLQRRNPDGGWGYHAGSSSWLEPTLYAAIALHGRPESTAAASLIDAWQKPSGAWSAQPQIAVESWATSLAIVLKCARGQYDASWSRGVDWLVQTAGIKIEPLTWTDRLFRRKPAVEQDETLTGWPWMPGTANWVEPTAQALRALRLSLRHPKAAQARDRIAVAERLLLDRRCADGGWNYGNKRVLGETLPSFQECTALALIGLCGNSALNLAPSLQLLQRNWASPQPPLARALTRIALRMHNLPFSDLRPDLDRNSDTTHIALSLFGEPEGAWRLWKGAAS